MTFDNGPFNTIGVSEQCVGFFNGSFQEKSADEAAADDAALSFFRWNGEKLEFAKNNSLVKENQTICEIPYAQTLFLER